MKVNVEIDATREEMRRLLGLPDVQPMQEDLMNRMRDKFAEAMDATDPVKMLAPFLPEGVKSMEEWQKAFWAAMTRGSGDGDK